MKSFLFVAAVAAIAVPAFVADASMAASTSAAFLSRN